MYSNSLPQVFWTSLIKQYLVLFLLLCLLTKQIPGVIKFTTVFTLPLVSLLSSDHIFLGLFLLLSILLLMNYALALQSAFFDCVLSFLASMSVLLFLVTAASSKARSLSPTSSIISLVSHEGLSSLIVWGWELTYWRKPRVRVDRVGCDMG